jgi:hypothetical protein
METPHSIETKLRHRGTNRLAVVVRVHDLWNHAPVSLDSERYVLLIASEREAQAAKVEAARAWIDAGASYICAWGPSSPDVEETFDYAAFLPELGEPVPFTLMTTSHQDEPLEEALWFAFYNGKTPDEPADGTRPVVVVVDSEALEARSIVWLGENAE